MIPYQNNVDAMPWIWLPIQAADVLMPSIICRFIKFPND